MDRSLAVRRVAPVAVFAAVLGGVVLVNDRGSGRPNGAPRPLPISPASGGAEGRANDASAPGVAMPAYWGEVRIPDRLLQGIPTEGRAYTLKADRSRIGALAEALGVKGEPRQRDGMWTVGDGDKVLQVMSYAGSPWHLGAEKPVREPQVVAEPATPAESPATSGKTATTPSPCPSAPPGAEPYCAQPVPMPEPTMPPQPSDATARAAMDRVLAALGVTDAKITTTPGYLGKEVTAAAVVGGLPTVGYETRVAVGADGGIVYANGFLARPEADATYPLLDPRKAVERSRGGYAGDIAVGRPAPAEPAQTAEDMPLVAPATAPASSGPGDAIEPATPPAPPHGDPPPVERKPAYREATSLRLGLMFMPSYESPEAGFLVPAWLLGFEGGTWEEPFLALPDEYVAKPPAPSGDPDEPVCNPSPCPTKDAPPPPDGSTSGGGSSGYDPGAPAVDTSRSGS